MAVYKIFPNKDSSIYSNYPTLNAGRDEVLEVSVKNTDKICRLPGGLILTIQYDNGLTRS